MIHGRQFFVDIVQVFILEFIVKRANVGFDFGSTQMDFRAMIFHVLDFGVNTKLFPRTQDAGLEEMAVRTAFEFRHGLRQLRVSSGGVDDLRSRAEEARRRGRPVADAAKLIRSKRGLDLLTFGNEPKGIYMYIYICGGF